MDENKEEVKRERRKKRCIKETNGKMPSIDPLNTKHDHRKKMDER